MHEELKNEMVEIRTSKNRTMTKNRDHFSKALMDMTKTSTPNDYRSTTFGSKKSRADRPIPQFNSVFDTRKNSTTALQIHSRKHTPSIISQPKDEELDQGKM